jgi:hypothetical protein
MFEFLLHATLQDRTCNIKRGKIVVLARVKDFKQGEMEGFTAVTYVQ